MQTQSYVLPRYRILAGVISLTAVLACPAQAVTIDGDVTPLPWDSANDVTIGQSAWGSVQIEAGDVVESKEAFIGGGSGSVGEASVSGVGAVWNAEFIQVGVEGTGTLDVENGGVVVSSGAAIASGIGSSGTVTVTGAGSLLDLSGVLNVGNDGTGVLNLRNGGKVIVSSGYTTVAGYSGSSGTVSVAGAGSQLNVQGLYIASEGAGTLAVENGGKVIASASVSIGEYSGAEGSAIVTGSGSELAMNRLYVGQRTSGTLTIERGGLAKVDGTESYNVFISENSFVQISDGFFAWQGDHFDAILQMILSGDFQYWNGTEYVSLAAGENYLDYFILEYVTNVADSAEFGGNANLAGLDGYTILTTVPEPGTYAAILSLLAAGVAVRMKRSARAK